MKHLQHHSILTSSQHGFWSKQSFETQLISTIQGLVWQLKSRKDKSRHHFTRLGQAFDKVSFQWLLLKLDFNDIRNNKLQWIATILRDRSQQVLVDVCRLEKVKVLSGVPHGSVLWPLLFLVNINNLPSICRYSKSQSYCEKVTVLRIFTSKR